MVKIILISVSLIVMAVLFRQGRRQRLALRQRRRDILDRLARRDENE